MRLGIVELAAAPARKAQNDLGHCAQTVERVGDDFMGQQFARPIGKADPNQAVRKDTNLGVEPTVVGVGRSEGFARVPNSPER